MGFLGVCYCKSCIEQAEKEGLNSCYICCKRIAAGMGQARIPCRTRATFEGSVTHIRTVPMCSVCSNSRADQKQKV